MLSLWYIWFIVVGIVDLVVCWICNFVVLSFCWLLTIEDVCIVVMLLTLLIMCGDVVSRFWLIATAASFWLFCFVCYCLLTLICNSIDSGYRSIWRLLLDIFMEVNLMLLETGVGCWIICLVALVVVQLRFGGFAVYWLALRSVSFTCLRLCCCCCFGHCFCFKFV